MLGGSAGAAAEGGRDQNKMFNPHKMERKSHSDRFLRAAMFLREPGADK